MNNKTNLISNQIALFFSQSLTRDNFDKIKIWLTNNQYSSDSVLGYVEDAPEDFPLLQASKVMENRFKHRINLSKKRMDLFYDPYVSGVSYENEQETIIDECKRCINEVYDENLSLIRIGCINQFIIIQDRAVDLVTPYLSQRATNIERIISGNSLKDAGIRINVEKEVNIDGKKIKTNNLFQILNGWGAINNIKNQGLLIIVDVNNSEVDKDSFTVSSAQELLNYLSGEIVETKVTKLI